VLNDDCCAGDCCMLPRRLARCSLSHNMHDFFSGMLSLINSLTDCSGTSMEKAEIERIRMLTVPENGFPLNHDSQQTGSTQIK